MYHYIVYSFYIHGITIFSQRVIIQSLSLPVAVFAVTWLKYCIYGVNTIYSINQSINQPNAVCVRRRTLVYHRLLHVI